MQSADGNDDSDHPLVQRKTYLLFQEIQGMGANTLLKVSEEELCERLILKYGGETDADKTHDSSTEPDSLTQTIRHTIAQRKANFFSGRRGNPETSARRKIA